ncbi:hypothetical protein R0K19_24420, partial [Bacillus sp. SIMBA_161]
EQLSTSNVVLGASPSSGHRAIFIVANVRGSSTAIETVYQEGEDGDLLTRINQIDATNNASKEMRTVNYDSGGTARIQSFGAVDMSGV